MRYTFFIGSLTGGGAERVICELASYLCEKGNDVEVLIVSKNRRSYDLDERVRVRSLESKKRIKFAPVRVLYKMMGLRRYLRDADRDIYVVFLPDTFRAIMHFRRMIKVPIVYSERIEPSSYPEKLQRCLVRLMPKVEGVVFQTENEKAFFEERARMQKTTVIPNAVARRFTQTVHSGERKKRIVSVGRFTSQKNHSLLIRAFADIANDFPGYELCLFGEGPLREDYMALAGRLGISDRLQLPGFSRDIAEEVKDASLFVLSSDFEGMPNALMEAMALGVPCISTDCAGGGAAFLINSGENGVLVPAGDEKALSDAMRSILSDPLQAEQLGRQARQLGVRLSPEKVYAAWEKFLTEVVADRR